LGGVGGWGWGVWGLGFGGGAAAVNRRRQRQEQAAAARRGQGGAGALGRTAAARRPSPGCRPCPAPQPPRPARRAPPPPSSSYRQTPARRPPGPAACTRPRWRCTPPRAAPRHLAHGRGRALVSRVVPARAARRARCVWGLVGEWSEGGRGRPGRTKHAGASRGGHRASGTRRQPPSRPASIMLRSSA
jgi:hypothetical protein